MIGTQLFRPESGTIYHHVVFAGQFTETIDVLRNDFAAEFFESGKFSFLGKCSTIVTQAFLTDSLPMVDRFGIRLVRWCKTNHISNHRDKFSVLQVLPDDTMALVFPGSDSD